MKRHRIRVKVEFEEIDSGIESFNCEPRKVDDGCFEIDLDGKFAMDIDVCEQSLLAANFPAIRDALSVHLAEMSKKKTIEEEGKSGVILALEEHSSPYRVDGEVGRFTFTTHELVNWEGKVWFNSRELFPEQRGVCYYQTKGFKEVGVFNGAVDQSYRKVRRNLNHQRRQEQGGTPLNTLRDIAKIEGEKVVNFWESTSTEILEKNGFNSSGAPLEESVVREVNFIEGGEINSGEEEMIDAWKEADIPDELKSEVKSNSVPYERVEKTVEISVDGVSTKKQKAHRKSGSDKSEEPKKDDSNQTKRVNNRIAYIEHNGRKYTLAARNYPTLMRIALAFLLNNTLWDKILCFYVDGERSITNAITGCFSWHPRIRLIMDWYHLEHKCAELLSSALKGRKIRNERLEQLTFFLWYGCVEKAMEYLNNLPSQDIKNLTALDTLRTYLENHRKKIPCYALRKQLGLCNSSNRVEKANDILVSHRQKRNGMSWSEQGSLSLAALSAVRRNGYQQTWLAYNVIPLTFYKAA